MRTKTLLITLTIGVVLLGACVSPTAPTPLVTPTATPSPVLETQTPTPVLPLTPTPAPAPAKFEVTSIDITPIVASSGQAVTVTAQVSNAGKTSGSYTVTLNINGVKEDTKDVVVASGSAKPVDFTIKRNTSGIYTIEVSGLTETLRVKDPGTFPHLAKFYCGRNSFFNKLQQLDSSQLKSLLNSLARWDIIIVNYTVASFAQQHIRYIKKQNPQAKILAYVEAGTGNSWRFLLTNDLQSQTKPSWLTNSNIDFYRNLAKYLNITPQDSNENFFLHHGSNNNIPANQNRVTLYTSIRGEEWPGMNPTGEWPTYLAHFVHDKVMATGLFDGVFYDNMWEQISYAPTIDIDNDGIADSPGIVNQKWQAGLTQVLKLTRELLGPEAIIFGNPGREWSANSPYFDYANGHMQENALGAEGWSSHDFAKIWSIYERNMGKPSPPSRIHIIAPDTNNKEYDPYKPDLPPSDLQKMRYGLAITLLDDGYFNFDIGSSFHGELWWFPEYDANLGLAKGKAQKQSDGTWIREFQNGIVVVNPTNGASTISFATVYQNASTGNKDTRFTVQPQDGGIFLLAH